MKVLPVNKWVWVLGVAVLAFYFLILRPLLHIGKTKFQDPHELHALPAGYVDDASRLNQTGMHEVWKISEDRKRAELQLAELLKRARRDGQKVSIAGKRHSMGGQTIVPDGIQIDMLPWNHMELDKLHSTLKVGAGAVWKDIIEFLDPYGLSVEVMQSNNSFSVGGSISVNCHGWQYDRPPIASTVESFRLMKADGEVVICSREVNPELFSLVLGGYGLFGVILDIQLRVVPNQRYEWSQYMVSVDEALATFDERIKDKPGVEMVYARMNIAPDRFLEDVIINAFIHDLAQPIPELEEPGMEDIRRAVFRGSVGSDYGKELRWTAETRLQPLLSGKIFSRNQLLNEGVEIFQNRTADSTDILHEYFVPRRRVVEFVEKMRKIIPAYEVDLLNVTVREVKEDEDTFLRYADQPMIAFVMLYVQSRNADGEAAMQALTRALIDAALDHEGRYYLPYRLHATREQFQKAYPQHQEFFELKRKYDPEELFQNQFYIKYNQDR